MASIINEDDTKIIFLVREDNQEAKDYLYEKYSPLIHKEINNVKKKAAVLGVEFADLSQEAMLAFSYAINNFNEDGESKFLTFATLCIRRKLANYIQKFETGKSKAMHDSLPLDASLNDDVSLINHIPNNSSDPLRKIITNESLKEAKITIDEKLSTNERIAIGYDLEGKTIDEIAEAMNLSKRQVYNLLFRARSKIK